ncbi:hypothetical protein [Methylophaga sp. SB9B]|uniref:hypothetical protein n=1 Tax=Methylophaga sp. SB9B TaxID=2570356 RepID=UPI0020000D2D|nr:hypothetical protein [Methylophaga sp. SB9B]
MPFLPVFLWTDILIFILLAVITAGIFYLRSKPHLRAPWVMVMQRKRGGYFSHYPAQLRHYRFS